MTTRPRRQTESIWLMVGISAGHGVKHFGQGALTVMMPFIKATLGIGDIAYGAIFTINSVSSGIANLPAGMLADMYRKQVAWMLSASMLMVGLGYFLIGISPALWLLGLSVAVVGFGTSLWHAPAFGTLAARYPNRRGVAMAAHLTGAQVGNATSPIIIGFLLGGSIFGLQFVGFEWRYVAIGVATPMLATAILVPILFKTAGAEATGTMKLRDYFQSASQLVKNIRILGLVTLGACRGAVHTAFQGFVVLYMRESLEMSAFTIGVHVSLLTLAGIASTPIMGWISDRTGRKPVIVGAMGTMALLVFLFLLAQDGLAFTILLATLGLFFFSVMPIITAAAMDQVGVGTEGSATAMMFTGGAVIGALSPIAAGALFDAEGWSAVVIFCGAIATFGTALALVIPMPRSTRT